MKWGQSSKLETPKINNQIIIIIIILRRCKDNYIYIDYFFSPTPFLSPFALLLLPPPLLFCPGLFLRIDLTTVFLFVLCLFWPPYGKGYEGVEKIGTAPRRNGLRRSTSLDDLLEPD
jgi:hypothetical protein